MALGDLSARDLRALLAGTAAPPTLELPAVPAPVLDALPRIPPHSVPTTPHCPVGEPLEIGDLIEPGDRVLVHGAVIHQSIVRGRRRSFEEAGGDSDVWELGAALVGLMPLQRVELATWSTERWPPEVPTGERYQFVFVIEAAWKPGGDEILQLPSAGIREIQHAALARALTTGLDAQQVPEATLDAELLGTWLLDEGPLLTRLKVTDEVLQKSWSAYLTTATRRAEARTRLLAHASLRALAAQEGWELTPEIVRGELEAFAQANAQDPQELVRALDADPNRRDAWLQGLQHQLLMDRALAHLAP